MATLSASKNYRLKSAATDYAKALNYYPGSTNVNTYAVDGSKDQIWYFYGGKLYNENDRSDTCLGRSDSNAVMLSASTAPTISSENAGTNKCYIKLYGTMYYLTATTSGALSWAQVTNTSNLTSAHKWRVEEIKRKTSVPFMGTEYFSSSSGMANGTWSSSITTNLKKFFAKLYRISSYTNVTNSNIGQNLYGALYSSTNYKGKFHTGLDFNNGSAYDTYNIYTPVSGTILKAVQTNGRINLYNEELDCTFVFLHMNINSNIVEGANVAANILMGKQSGWSNSTPTYYASHLHIEVHSGEYTGNASTIPADSFTSLGAVSPYSYIASCV